MKSSQKHVYMIVIVILFAVIGYLLGSSAQSSPEESKIAAYYANSVATLVSPHSIRRSMDRGFHDYIVVDTRAASDYENGHISGALNIDSEQSVDEVVTAFREIERDAKKPILIYCYSASCMNGRKVGHKLAQSGIYVHEMTIGYNEWEFFPDTWNYPQEAGTYDIENYITRGTEPGEPEQNLQGLLHGCGIEGELSC